MPATYKLTYFDARGCAEPIRYALAYGKANWEDDQVTMEMWPSVKPKTPMGQIPVLTLADGRQLAQSRAILRYVARELHLAPQDNFEAAEADMLVDGILGDVYSKFTEVYVPLFYGKKEESKQKWVEFKKATLATYLDIYEKRLAKSGDWLVGGKVSFADLVLGEFVERWVSLFDPECVKNHPKLADHAKRVAALPGIKEYVAKRKAFFA